MLALAVLRVRASIPYPGLHVRGQANQTLCTAEGTASMVGSKTESGSFLSAVVEGSVPFQCLDIPKSMCLNSSISWDEFNHILA